MKDIQEIIKYTSSLKLLFVEDDPLARESAKILLEDFFADITMAVDGADGVDKFKSNDIDIVITDINMPRLNGLEMIQEIRKINKDIPIVILSAHIKPEYFIQSIKLNVKGYLLKPMDVDSMLDVFETVVASIRLKAEIFNNMKLKERMEHALLGNNDALWDWDLLTDSVHFSPRWKEMLGYEDDELASKLSNWEDRVHPDDLSSCLSAIKDNIDAKTDNFENTHRLKHKNGHWIWILDRGKTIYDEQGKAIRMIGTHTDITKTKEMEIEFYKQSKQIQEHDKYLQYIIDSIHDPIMVIKEDYSVELMNSVLRNQLNSLDIADINNPKCYEISHRRSTPCDGDEHQCPLQYVMETKSAISIVHNHCDANGSKHYIELASTPLFDKYKKCVGIIESARDITAHLKTQDELCKQKDMLHYQANHDMLTGLANRIFFDDRLNQAILRAKRSGEKLALFFMDLDKFKRINDSLGHKAGDFVLKIVSQRMKRKMREEDTLARFGGDEFTIIIENIKQSTDASILAKKLLNALEIPIDFEGESLNISASIGISIYPDNAINPKDLLKHADNAMYKAKESDENIVYYNDSDNAEELLKK